MPRKSLKSLFLIPNPYTKVTLLESVKGVVIFAAGYGHKISHFHKTGLNEKTKSNTKMEALKSFYVK